MCASMAVDELCKPSTIVGVTRKSDFPVGAALHLRRRHTKDGVPLPTDRRWRSRYFDADSLSRQSNPAAMV